MEVYLGVTSSLLRSMSWNSITIFSIIYWYLIGNSHIILKVAPLDAFFLLNVSLKLIISNVFIKIWLFKRYSS